MILLAGFLDVLFRAFVFIGLALSVGGIAFYYLVLRPNAVDHTSLKRTAAIVAIGGFVVAASQALTLVVAAAALADQMSHWPLAELLRTGFARVGLIHASLALILGLVALRLQGRAQSAGLWATVAAIGALVLVSGAWLTHGASRLANAAPLMTVTVIHQLAAAVWIGGMVHLTSQWRLLQRVPFGRSLWPRLLARFSPVALTSVVVLVAAGIYLSWEYIGGGYGLVGTAYGTMLITKIVLMCVLLLLGGINNLTIRQWKLTGDGTDLVRRVPYFAEVEAGIGLIILMLAAALTSQPPAIDVLNERATPAEVLHVLAPKVPRLAPPPHAQMLATANSSTDLYALPGTISKLQSDFNHNWAGICVILVGLGAFLNRLTRWRWTRHWPLLFLPLALFLLVIGEPNGWPLGPEPFWKTLIAPEVMQHRMATLLVVVLGLVEWRAEALPQSSMRWRYLLPLLFAVGGALLLTHSHSVFAIKWAFLVEVSHNAIAIFAVLAGAGAWLDLRMSGREGRIGGILWPVCVTLVGFVLLFYRE